MKECLVFGQTCVWNLCLKVHVELGTLIFSSALRWIMCGSDKDGCFSYVVLQNKPLQNSGLKQWQQFLGSHFCNLGRVWQKSFIASQLGVSSKTGDWNDLKVSPFTHLAIDASCSCNLSQGWWWKHLVSPGILWFFTSWWLGSKYQGPKGGTMRELYPFCVLDFEVTEHHFCLTPLFAADISCPGSRHGKGEFTSQ